MPPYFKKVRVRTYKFFPYIEYLGPYLGQGLFGNGLGNNEIVTDLKSGTKEPYIREGPRTPSV